MVFRHYENGLCGNSPLHDELARAEERVRELEEENERLREAQRWIPVGERLPEDGECVLVLDESNGAITTGLHCEQVPQWELAEGLFFHGDKYAWITHWMPLPEPPEEAK